MGKFGVFKRYRDGDPLFVSWAETLEDAKKQVQDLAKSDGNLTYFVHDFLHTKEDWSWSPDDDLS